LRPTFSANDEIEMGVHGAESKAGGGSQAFGLPENVRFRAVAFQGCSEARKSYKLQGGCFPLLLARSQAMDTAIQPCCLVCEDQALIGFALEAYLEDEGFAVAG
jgi:hypothetical protein